MTLNDLERRNGYGHNDNVDSRQTNNTQAKGAQKQQNALKGESDLSLSSNVLSRLLLYELF